MAASNKTGAKSGSRSGIKDTTTRRTANNKTANKKTTNSRTTNGRRADSRKAASYQEEELDDKLIQEVLLIAAFAVCVFLFLCNFGIIGSFGNTLSNIQFGLFGLPAYIAPLLLFFAIAFGMINQGSAAAKRKLISGIVLFVLISMLCELISGRLKSMTEYDIIALYQDIVEKRNGGGVLAGSLAYLSYRYLSTIGTVLLILVLGLICVVLLTEKSVISGAKKSGKILAESAKRLETGRFTEEISGDDEEEGYGEEESDRIRRERLREEKKERAARRREEQEERAALRRREQEERAELRRRGQEEKAKRKQEKQEVKEDEKILRMNKKSRGVMLDTMITEPEAPEKVRDDIHEITIQEAVEEIIPKPQERHIFRTESEDDEVREISYYNASSYNTSSYDADDNGSGNSVSDTDGGYHAVREEISAPQELSHTAPGRERMREQTVEFTPERIVPAKVSNQKKEPVMNKRYVFPPVTLLKKGKNTAKGDSNAELRNTALHLQQTLETFGVKVTITDISQGPSVTRFELQPEQGVKVSKIVGLADDIKLNLAATDIRIEAPIPGKAAVGIEVPNKENATVSFRELIESKEYQTFSSRIAFAVGKDIGGQVVVADIAKMPHMLIAGATGSGKSVCINTIIMSILYKAHPDDVKLIMVDPKVVELSVYNGIPHLLLPVVTDPKKAASALHWGVAEMTDRYNKFAEFGVRDVKGYNQKVEDMIKRGEADESVKKMPQIVIIVDELADLMMVAPGEVEESICRLAQLARAAGIHLIIATQRPSVDVITGLIKANMPSRIAFAVSSGVDSRTILDMVGAEKLLGKGDMLFYPQGYSKPARVQGAFISDEEVQDVVDFLKDQQIISTYSPDIEQQMKEAGSVAGGPSADGASNFDEYFAEAGKFIIEKDKASIGMLQRVFKIGFNRAARIMDQLCEAGVVGEEEGTKPRKVLMSPEQFESYIEENV